MRKALIVSVLVLVLAIGAGGAVVATAWRSMHEPYKGYETTEQFVTIRQGAGSGEIGRQLADAHVVNDARVFRLALWWAREGRNLQAGEYRFDHPLSALDVIDRLRRGDVYTRRITFPEGLTIEEMAKLYESRAFGSARDFIEAARDAARVRDLDPAAADLEGYLFPETYPVPRGMPASKTPRMFNLPSCDRFAASAKSAKETCIPRN